MTGTDDAGDVAGFPGGPDAAGRNRLHGRRRAARVRDRTGVRIPAGRPRRRRGQVAPRGRVRQAPRGDEPAVEPGRTPGEPVRQGDSGLGEPVGTCTCSRRRPTRSDGRASCARSTARRAAARPPSWPTTTPTRATTRCGCRSGAGQTAHFDSDDLELGNRAKGLSGRTGAGAGAWRLTLYGLGRGARLRARGGRLPGGHERGRRRVKRSGAPGGVLQSRHQPPHERAAAGEPLLARGGGVDRRHRRPGAAPRHDGTRAGARDRRGGADGRRTGIGRARRDHVRRTRRRHPQVAAARRVGPPRGRAEPAVKPVGTPDERVARRRRARARGSACGAAAAACDGGDGAPGRRRDPGPLERGGGRPLRRGPAPRRRCATNSAPWSGRGARRSAG